MKTIIAGTRNFNDYQFLKEKIDNLDINITEIVSGTARGADILGERYAREHNIPVKRFPADWEKYGKGAGFIRNEQMGNYADYLIAFWDSKSRGTFHMIEYMKKIGKHGTIYVY